MRFYLKVFMLIAVQELSAAKRNKHCISSIYDNNLYRKPYVLKLRTEFPSSDNNESSVGIITSVVPVIQSKNIKNGQYSSSVIFPSRNFNFGPINGGRYLSATGTKNYAFGNNARKGRTSEQTLFLNDITNTRDKDQSKANKRFFRGHNYEANLDDKASGKSIVSNSERFIGGGNRRGKSLIGGRNSFVREENLDGIAKYHGKGLASSGKWLTGDIKLIGIEGLIPDNNVDKGRRRGPERPGRYYSGYNGRNRFIIVKNLYDRPKYDDIINANRINYNDLSRSRTSGPGYPYYSGCSYNKPGQNFSTRSSNRVSCKNNANLSLNNSAKARSTIVITENQPVVNHRGCDSLDDKNLRGGMDLIEKIRASQTIDSM